MRWQQSSDLAEKRRVVWSGPEHVWFSRYIACQQVMEQLKIKPVRRGAMMPTGAVPVGAIYGKGQHTTEQKAMINAKIFKNVDGERHDDGRYAQFREEAAKFIPPERISTDAVRTFAYGTDASFYRMIPNTVVKVHNEAEVQQVWGLVQVVN